MRNWPRAMRGGLLAIILLPGILRAQSEATVLDAEAAEQFRQALAKIAPLEHWNATWEEGAPKICWRLFRPNPQQYRSLIQIIHSFQGRMNWTIVAPPECLSPSFGKVLVAPPLMAIPNAGVVFTRQKFDPKDVAIDLKNLAQAIERELKLSDTKTVAFTPEMLTREGLRKSKGEFEDFLEGGELTVYLIVNPGSTEHFGTTDEDFFLHFAPFDDELTAIFSDILQTDLTQGHGRAMTDEEVEQVKRKYPTFWKIADFYEGGYLTPGEAKHLLEECTALSEKAKLPVALRGLDKLIRIANWAASKGYGVYFEPP